MKNPDDSQLENKTLGGTETKTVTARHTDPIGTFTGKGHDGYDQDGFDYDVVRGIPMPADSNRQAAPKVSHLEDAEEDHCM